MIFDTPGVAVGLIGSAKVCILEDDRSSVLGPGARPCSSCAGTGGHAEEIGRRVLRVTCWACHGTRVSRGEEKPRGSRR